MATYKLIVDVIQAYDLRPNDGKGSASPFVVVTFDSVQAWTSTKKKALNPVWNERFYFDVSDLCAISELFLEACVYSGQFEGSNSFLGKVRIRADSFVTFSHAILLHHPLEKLGMFSHGVTGALDLKVHIIDEPSVKASSPLPTVDSQICCPEFHISNILGSNLHDHSLVPQAIPLQCLKEITNNFSDERILGQGGFGVVYKGVLQNGEIVAVKKILSSLRPGLEKQFENEVHHLMMLKHPNIVRCVGYCYETRNECFEYKGKLIFAEMAERLLCLEYLPNGSLDKYLSDESSGLDWSTRYNIIEGICYGLCHLHEKIAKPIIHLDLKPPNILLDDGMMPKITDFGLSRLLDQQKTICTSSCDGTFGYMAPELIHGGTITPKSDIFSLGVIIMEIITGHRDYPDITRTTSDDFIELTLRKWRNVLQRSPWCKSLETECKQIKICIQVGLMCVSFDRTKRPSMTKVISMLQGSESIDCDVSNDAA